MEKFSVTLNYNGNYGFAEYDEATKTAAVTLPVLEARAAVEEFLRSPLTLDLPAGETIRDFATKTLMPLASLENFKTCLTRLWGRTGVRVEWSMPPGMAEKIIL